MKNNKDKKNTKEEQEKAIVLHYYLKIITYSTKKQMMGLSRTVVMTGIRHVFYLGRTKDQRICVSLHTKNMQYSKTEMIKDNFQPWPWLRGCLKDPTFGEEGTIVL